MQLQTENEHQDRQ